LKNLSSTDKIRDNSKVGSGFGKNISNWLDRDMAYPTNVLHMATVVAQRMNRKAVGIDILPEYYKITTERLDDVVQWTLLEPDKHYGKAKNI
jgi:site-specific DNA-methyltransferase (adenine-specific)/site-specific DNA-methyltransferase (cytosine-N4-specific)